MAGCHFGERRIDHRSTPVCGPAERTVGEQPQPVGDAVLGDTAAKMFVVPDTQLNLDGVDRGNPSRLFDLSDRHVAETDRVDQPSAFQAGQCTDARGERRPGIRRVKLIESDAVDAERAPAVFASCRDLFGATIGLPPAVRACQPAFGGHLHPRSIASPRRERRRDEPFVVTALAVVPAIRVGSVEKGQTGVHGCMKHGEALRIVAIELG